MEELNFLNENIEIDYLMFEKEYINQ